MKVGRFIYSNRKNIQRMYSLKCCGCPSPLCTFDGSQGRGRLYPFFCFWQAKIPATGAQYSCLNTRWWDARCRVQWCIWCWAHSNSANAVNLDSSIRPWTSHVLAPDERHITGALPPPGRGKLRQRRRAPSPIKSQSLQRKFSFPQESEQPFSRQTITET